MGDDLIEFGEFWKQYPRKIARAHALKMWNRLTEEEQKLALEAIPKHAAAWKAESRESHRIPHAGTWLNPVDGRRWEDEIELPKPKADPSWCKSERGILAEGERRGLSPRAGESLWDYRARIEAA